MLKLGASNKKSDIQNFKQKEHEEFTISLRYIFQASSLNLIFGLELNLEILTISI